MPVGKCKDTLFHLARQIVGEISSSFFCAINASDL
jgi:hypothetical protein